MKLFILDANVVLRFLLADDPAQSPKAKALFTLAESGRVRLQLSHVAVAEVAWVLSSFFGFSRQDIGPKLRGLLLHKGVEIDDEGLILNALDRFARVNADFPDCYAAALSARSTVPIASYDRDFKKFSDVTCLRPEIILSEERPD